MCARISGPITFKLKIHVPLLEKKKKKNEVANIAPVPYSSTFLYADVQGSEYWSTDYSSYGLNGFNTVGLSS